jgi:hypothetical protein
VIAAGILKYVTGDDDDVVISNVEWRVDVKEGNVVRRL